MPNQWMEGWGTYEAIATATALVGSGWVVLSAGSGSPSIFRDAAGSWFRVSATQHRYGRAIIDDDIYCVGHRVYIEGALGAGNINIGPGLIGAVSTLSIGLSALAQPVLNRGGVAIYTAPDSLSFGVANYLDFVYNRALGTCDFYLNNTLLTTVAGIVSIGAINSLYVGSRSGFASPAGLVRISDLYWNSGNERWGDMSVVRLPPDADVAGGGWTVTGAATGSAALDNVPGLTTEYIEADVVGDISEYEIPSLPPGVFQIHNVRHQYRAQKTTAGDSNVQGGLVVNGVDYLGADNVMLEGTYENYFDNYPVNPNTGVAWVPTDFDADKVQLRYERTL